MIGARVVGAYATAVVLLAGAVGCISSNTEKISDEEQVAVEPVESAPEPALATGPTDSADGLTWDVPEIFVREKPVSAMRAAQYRLPGEEGAENGELIVFFFGPGVGGSTEANLTRWAGQLMQEDGGDPMENAVTEIFTSSGGLKVTTIELTGRYVSSNMGSGPSYDEEGWALYGAVIEGEGGPWFFKAVGPQSVLERHRDALQRLYNGVRLEAS